MSQYHYYQKEGGEEEWKIVPVNKVGELPPHMYRTILSIDTPPTESTTKEGYHAIKFSGPLYFDLDDAASPASTAKHLVALIDKLKKLDVEETCLAIYASGGKGFHLTVDQENFIEKPQKGYGYLPAIYKEIAFELSVASMDFRVYSARKGRMLRCANIKRPNGLHKVQITAEEARNIAAMGKEEAEKFYKDLCAEPRESFATVSEGRAFGLQGLFDSSKKKVEGLGKKAAKAKPVDLPDDLPSFDAMLRGEGLRSDSGFHPIAMQISITAHARGMTCEELVEAASGLIENHASDGSRYDTADKRRREIRRMFDYTEDNPCYAYSPGAIRCLLSHQAPDLAGIEASVEEVQEGIDNPSESSEYDHAGVILTSGGVSIPVEGGTKRALALGFHETTEMISSTTGNATVLQARVTIPGGKDLGIKSFELDAFYSANSLNKAVMPFGQVFTGNDTQARGVYLRLVEKARNGGRRLYVLNREGIDVVSLPFHPNENVQKGVLVFADRLSVLRSKEAEGYEDFKVKFVGYPNPLGVFQSDLSMAPRIKDAKPEEIELLRETLWHLLKCQTPAYLSKLIGWMTACHYRMIFHKGYQQFPLLHVNGAAGAGKTSMVKLVANMHYYRGEAKMLTPSSTAFAIKEAAAASASIPLIIDEYKPQAMSQGRHDEFKLMFRDAYNCRETARGGGTRESSDFRVIQSTQLAAPICFVAEAAESEPAVMERVVLLTLVKPPATRQEEFFKHFSAANRNRETLGIIGAFMAKAIVNTYTVEKLQEEFDPIYNDTRKELMLQPGEEQTLSFAQRKSKTSAKERTVYNYAVLRFGLAKFQAVVTKIMGSDENAERKADVLEALEAMYVEATSSVSELQSQTTPEWLKVFNALSGMAAADDYTSYKLTEGKHYAVTEHNGETILEIDARMCYMKYRISCSAQNDKPLFPSEMAFVHALQYLPDKVESPNTINCPGGSFAFNLNAMRLQGFIDMPEGRR